MSNHFSAAMLKFPGDDPRLDLTDLFVFASRSETQGLVLLEALALGVPVVALAELGTREIVLPERGAVAASGDTEEFAAVVTRLLRENDVEPSVIELNVETVRALKDDGIHAVYGDASRRETLEEMNPKYPPPNGWDPKTVVIT